MRAPACPRSGGASKSPSSSHKPLTASGHQGPSHSKRGLPKRCLARREVSARQVLCSLPASRRPPPNGPGDERSQRAGTAAQCGGRRVPGTPTDVDTAVQARRSIQARCETNLARCTNFSVSAIVSASGRSRCRDSVRLRNSSHNPVRKAREAVADPKTEA